MRTLGCRSRTSLEKSEAGLRCVVRAAPVRAAVTVWPVAPPTPVPALPVADRCGHAPGGCGGGRWEMVMEEGWFPHEERVDGTRSPSPVRLSALRRAGSPAQRAWAGAGGHGGSPGAGVPAWFPLSRRRCYFPSTRDSRNTNFPLSPVLVCVSHVPRVAQPSPDSGTRFSAQNQVPLFSLLLSPPLLSLFFRFSGLAV